jgi:hypothetical protein
LITIALTETEPQILIDQLKLQFLNLLRMEKHRLMKPRVLKVPRRPNWSVMMDKLNLLEIKWTLINTSHLLHLLKNL